MTVKDMKELLSNSEKSFPELENLIANKDDNTILNIFDRNDYLAAKLWTLQDVENQLDEMIDMIPKQIQSIAPLSTKKHEILNNCCTNDFDVLNDCTDNEWNIIQSAITNNAITITHTPYVINGCIIDITNLEQPEYVCYECKAYPINRKIIMCTNHKPLKPNRKYIFHDNNEKQYPVYPIDCIPKHPENNSYWICKTC